jgi:chemotaxis protein methyltransferase CheR
MMNGTIRDSDEAVDQPGSASAPAVDLCPRALAKLARRLERSRGFDLLSYKTKVLQRRLRTRLRAHRCADLNEYLRVLDRDDREEELLYKALIINVSSFFRNPETFWFLRDRVLPGIMTQKRALGRELLMVSAPCAEGEEPYSLAMMLRSFFTNDLARVRCRIVGLDIDPQAVSRAERGSYAEDRLTGLPSNYRERFFRGDGRTYVVSDEVRSLVEFRRSDLRQGFDFTGVDLIMCRNLLIYFKREVQHRIIMALAGGMAEGGYLVLGKTETMATALRCLFRVTDLSEHIYQKAGVEPCGWR